MKLKMHMLAVCSFLCLWPVLVMGQTGYIATDTSIMSGLKLIDGGDILNSKLCQINKNGELIQYTPDEITEFGFDNGQEYFSKEIMISDTPQKVFMERLVKGNTSLYYYREKGLKTYFLEIDSTSFFELPKPDAENEDYNFNKVLLEVTSDNPDLIDASKLVSYDKKSLAKFIDVYNTAEKIHSFPHFKYGFISGYESLKLIPNSENITYYLSLLDYNYDGGFTLGLFIDNPLMVSDFSLHTELYYSRHGFSINKIIDTKDINFVVNVASLKLPIMIRYAIPSKRIRPYINAGGIVNYNFKNENFLYEATIGESTILVFEVQESSFISKSQLGYSVGGGLEIKLNYKNSLFLEYRSNKLYPVTKANSFSYSENIFVTGINF